MAGTVTTSVKRACDACHRRKVKCDGVNPCRNCHTAQLTCTYHAIPQKKGPKGSRAKVISELRETQRQTSLSAQVHNRMAGMMPPPSVPTLAPTPGLLSCDVIKECIDFFFANMYSSMPVLSRQRLEQQALRMDQDQDLDTYCLLAALSAFVMIQPGMNIPGDPYGLDSTPGANIVSSNVLLDEVMRVRKGFDYTEKPTLNSLCTSYFVFACFYASEMHDRAWFHLREAATMIHMAGMNKEDMFTKLEDVVDSSRKRRLYWLLLVTERAYALQRDRPVTLQSSVNPPSLVDDPNDLGHHLNSFIPLCHLFRPFDEPFLAAWSEIRSNWPAAYLSSLQKSLAEIIPPYNRYGDQQLHDLRSNQQWLKTMVWRLAGNNSHGEDQILLSMNMASNTLAASPMPQQKPASLTAPYLAKLFDVASSMTDVLLLCPASKDPFSPGPREQLDPLVNVLTTLRNRDYRFLPLLISKINETLPQLCNPMLQSVPDSVASKACNLDIFDGFGNAGMAQPPVLMDDYEKKYIPPMMMTDYEENYNRSDSMQEFEKYNPRVEEAVDPGNSRCGSAPNHETSFMGSPISSGTERSQGVADNPYTSISGIVINQMGLPSLNGQVSTNPSQTPQTHRQPQQPMASMQNANGHMRHGVRNHVEHSPSVNVDHANYTFGQSFDNGIAYMNAMSQGLGTNIHVDRREPPRTNSFAVGPNSHATRPEFQAPQRANSAMGTTVPLGLSSSALGLEMHMGFPR